jgi:hypothetical protein
MPMLRAAICSCCDIFETFRNPAMRFLIGHNASVRPLVKRDKPTRRHAGMETAAYFLEKAAQCRRLADEWNPLSRFLQPGYCSSLAGTSGLRR